MVALGGAVPIADRLKQAHQSMDTVALLRPITKYAAEIDSPSAISEAIASAFRAAESGRPGTAFLGLPKDVMKAPAPGPVLTPAAVPRLGAANSEAIAEAARMIDAAERPVVLVGMLASQGAVAEAVRVLLARTRLAVAGTYQAAGVVPRDRLDCFGGRVGLFHNQPADRLLDEADVVITIGFDPVEYDPGALERRPQAQADPYRLHPGRLRPVLPPRHRADGRQRRHPARALGAAEAEGATDAVGVAGRDPSRAHDGRRTKPRSATARPSIRCGWCMSCRS